MMDELIGGLAMMLQKSLTRFPSSSKAVSFSAKGSGWMHATSTWGGSGKKIKVQVSETLNKILKNYYSALEFELNP